MAQTNFTPISLYFSATAAAVPTAGNLVAGELAINTNDGKLFYKDSAGVVQTLATKGSASVGGSNTQVQYNNAGALAGSANFVFDGTNVGIGTASPASKLNVYSTTNTTADFAGSLRVTNASFTAGTYAGTLFATADGLNSYVTGIRQASFGGILTFGTNDGTNATSLVERMRIDSSGNVGIGTSSPNTALTIQSSGEGCYIARDGGNAPDIRLRQSRGTFASKTTSVNGDLTGQLHFEGYDGSAYLDRALIGGVIDGVVSAGVVPTAIRFVTGSTSPTERMRIDSSGNLLVGTTSVVQSGKISVVDGPISTLNAGAGFSANLSTSTGDQFYFRTGSGVSGGTLAGYITCPTSNTTQYLSISDYRLKDNVAPMSGALGLVLQLKPCTYKWIVDGSNGQGFIAHELQKIVPDCVSGQKDQVNEDGSIKPQGIDTSFLVATLVSAIQELNAEVQALKQQLGK